MVRINQPKRPDQRLIIQMKKPGASVTVFGTAACLLSIASDFETHDKLSYPYGTPGYWSHLSWVSLTFCPPPPPPFFLS